uniref:Uncharacterized protein n=1 Tax=Romanomermis culicivorax TaxID=13658 RepID=A0A915KLJ2_ROMCU
MKKDRLHEEGIKKVYSAKRIQQMMAEEILIDYWEWQREQRPMISPISLENHGVAKYFANDHQEWPMIRPTANGRWHVQACLFANRQLVIKAQ